MSKDVLAQVTDNPKKEVPRLKALVHTNHEEVENGKPPKREPIYYTIPRDKWVQVESTYDAANRIKQKVRKITNSSLVRVGVTEKTTGHRSKPVVVVRRDKLPNHSQQANISIEELSERLPATVDGNAGNKNVSEVVSDIEITFDERELATSATCSWDTPYYNQDFSDNVPGGCQISSGGIGTVCTPAQNDGTGAQQLLTCAHLFGENGEGDAVNQSGTKIGNCAASVWRWNDKDSGDQDADASRAFDCATITPDSGVDVSYTFAEDDGTYSIESIVGRTGWDLIKDGFTIKRQGRTSGRQSGEVTTAFTNQTFETSAVSNDGDSGGPHYDEVYGDNREKDFSIAGIHSYGENSGCSYSGAIWVGKAEKEFNVTI